MTQIATVERLLPDGRAEISVARQSACAHDCHDCAGCGATAAPVIAEAVNPIHAQPGQKVVVESSTKKLLGVIALVYILPFFLFFAAYFAIPAALDAQRVLLSVLAFFLGGVPALLYDRRLRRSGGMRMTIVRLF